LTSTGLCTKCKCVEFEPETKDPEEVIYPVTGVTPRL